MQIPVIIAHKGRTLRHALQKKQALPHTCSVPNCITPRELCHATKVVYMFVCCVCRSGYVGSTKRKLHIRVREHVSSKSSAIFQHKLSCPNAKWNISIISRAKDPVDLRIREALEIHTRKPSLNNKEEIQNFRLLWLIPLFPLPHTHTHTWSLILFLSHCLHSHSLSTPLPARRIPAPNVSLVRPPPQLFVCLCECPCFG